MGKQGGKTVVPKLRFPDFRNLGGWTTYSLSEISKFVTERVGTTSCTPYTVTSGVGLVSQEEKLGRTIAGNSLKNYVVLQSNDFAYNKSATKAFPQGFIVRYTGNERAAVPNSIFSCFRVDQRIILPAFMENLFLANLHGKWLRTRLAVGARAHGSLQVSDEDLMALPVPLPSGTESLTEQQKIADCLTSLDEVISAQGRKVETLKAHKRGLMQHLFPREGETQPRFRFPNFRDAPDWEEFTIQKLIDQNFIVGHLDGNHGELYPRSDEFVADGIPYITANDFKNGFVQFEYCKRLPMERARRFRKGVARDGDILFAHNATVGPVAKLRIEDEFVILSTTATYFRCDKNKLVNDFLLSALTSPSFVAQYTRVMSQSTRNQVPITAQRKFSISIPRLLEQQHIADCLSSLDAAIVAAFGQLTALKTHKQGLMQQLFPSQGAG